MHPLSLPRRNYSSPLSPPRSFHVTPSRAASYQKGPLPRIATFDLHECDRRTIERTEPLVSGKIGVVRDATAPLRLDVRCTQASAGWAESPRQTSH
ncbi:hypothetical protein M8818_001499 [Zalaria obscura]|uniref:Uncharacterized protein n=1 Tax=Zalaria obscura TaxID=2024903 RepID=A0ACC3SPE8_9PEZI